MLTNSPLGSIDTCTRHFVDNVQHKKHSQEH